jgi:cytoskeletal protein CcmA (bactofilin family)
VIGPAGSVTGDIKCKTADIEGRFNGRIEVDELLSIKAKATITGEVITGRLAVEPGAVFAASCTMRNVIKKTIPPVNERQQQAG